MDLAISELKLTADSWAERSPSSPLPAIRRSNPSGSTKLTRHGPTVSAVTSKASPEIIALSPIISPGSTNFGTRTLPSFEVVDKLDFAGAKHKCATGHLTLNKKNGAARVSGQVREAAEGLQEIG